MYQVLLHNKDGDLFQNLAAWAQSSEGSIKGVLDTALMCVGAEGKSRGTSLAYRNLARMFPQDVDAVKTGLHVNRGNVDKLKIEGVGSKWRARQLPHLVHHSEDFAVKREGKGEGKARVKREGVCVSRMDTLVDNIFFNAHHELMRLNGLSCRDTGKRTPAVPMR